MNTLVPYMQTPIASAGRVVLDKLQVPTSCLAKPHINLFRVILATNVFNNLLKKLSSSEIDLVIIS